MKLLDDYFKLQKQVHEYFGYVEDWAAIPMDDCTDKDWALDQNEDGSGEIHFGEKVDVVEWHTGDQDEIMSRKDGKTLECYSHDIYTQRFLPKWVYRGEEYTMVVCDTRTDGNRFLCVFDNSREFDKSELIRKENI